MKNKLIAFSDQEITWVQEEANRREITFSDMIRRIIDDRYECNSFSSLSVPSDFTSVTFIPRISGAEINLNHKEN